MVAVQQSRPSEQDSVQTALVARGNSPSSVGALAVRLWRTQEGTESSELPWEGNDPVIGLALDVLSASEGSVATLRGRFLIATFPGIQAAILAARRLQWAYQGLSEGSWTAGTSIAVLVHCTEIPPGPGAEIGERDSVALDAVEKASPGQILLTARAGEILRDLPGLPVRVATEAILCELLWNNAAEKTSRASDEEMLSEFIRRHGLENQAPALAQTASASVAAAHEPKVYSLATDPAAVDSDAGNSAEARRISPRILLRAGCGIAAMLAIAAFFVFSHKSQTNPAPVAVQQTAPAAVTPAPVIQQPQSQPPTPPSALTRASAPAPAKATAAAQVSRKQEEAAHAKPASSESGKPPAAGTSAPSASCDLDQSLVPKMLDQAEGSRAQGDYPAAQRQFLRVLACQPNNPRARSGLDQTHLDMQHR